MKFLPRWFVIFFSLAVAGAPTWAKPQKKKNEAPQGEYKIVEVSALSITIELGSSGDSHETYKIADSTKITLNGAPARASDLRAGMLAHINVGSDHTTATSISAHDPPSHPHKGKAG